MHATLVTPATLTTGVNSFAAPTDTMLSASTPYYVQAVYTGTGTDPKLVYNTGSFWDSGSAAGWQINNSRWYFNGWTTNNIRLKIEVKGSEAGSGTNNTPTFAVATATRSVAENTAAGQSVGAVVTATDADNDTLTYTLEGTDAASFDIVGTSGQIQTNAALTTRRNPAIP